MLFNEQCPESNCFANPTGASEGSVEALPASVLEQAAWSYLLAAHGGGGAAVVTAMICGCDASRTAAGRAYC